MKPTFTIILNLVIVQCMLCAWINDANGTTVAESHAISISEVITDVTCSGGSDGAIDITASGGTAPYTYSWSNGAVTEDISGLAAGSYTVTVTDDDGATVMETFIVDPGLDLNSGTNDNIKDVTCYQGKDASIKITVSAGIGPYSYSWTNEDGDPVGDGKSLLKDLQAGDYTVLVTDGNGCTLSKTFTVTEPPAVFTVTPTLTNVTCNGDNDGAISLAVITSGSGNGNFSYSWTHGASGSSISGLAPGNYEVEISDNKDCEIHTFTITEPDLLALSTTQVNVDCNGNSTGSIDLTVTGGTGPFTYSWTNGSSSEDISSLAAGSYTVTVTDANGCSDNTMVTISQPDVLALSTTQVNVDCNGNSTGSIDLTVTGGTGPFTYSWTNGSSTEDISSLAAGSYTVTVTDANGCVEGTTVNINQPDVLALSSTQVNVLCNGNSTGSIDLTVTGGTGPFTYSWSNGSSSEDITTLAAGSYTVTVTDANGCVEGTTVNITQPDALALSTTQVNVLCNGNSTGSIDLTVTGGTGPFTYSWSNGSSSQDVGSLTAGSYTVTVTDANGCSDNTMVTITQPNALALSTTQVNVDCNGNSTGSIDLTVTGGTGPYTYSWTNGSSSEDIASLSAGSYTVTVTDANGCSDNSMVTITQPNALALSTTQVNVLCNGNSTGSIDLTVTGGTGPFTYSWSNGSSSEDLSSLSAGPYTVTVTDANGCTDNTMVTITEPSVLSLSTTQVDLVCNGDSNGSIDLTVAGGTAPYSYSWTNGSSSEDISSLTAGSYTVTVTDANGCTDNTMVTITEPTAINLSTTQVNLTCKGDTNGSIDLTVSGGNAPYSYSWTNGATSQDLSSLTAGSYTVTVTDASGCTEGTTVILTEPATTMNASTVISNVSCNAGSDGAINLTVTGGTAPYTYAWSNGAITEDVTGLAAGTYSVTITDAVGCITIPNLNVTEPAVLSLSTSKTDIDCNGNSNGTIDLTVTGGTAPYTYSWTNGSSSEDLTALAAGSYTVTVTDANGCSDNTMVTITEPNALGLSSTKTDVSCNAGNDGSIDLTVTGGTAPYTYVWSNGESTQDLSSLSAGNYSVTVTDANGCFDNLLISVIEPSAINLSEVVVDAGCAGGSSGSIDLTVSGGTAPYTYSWSNGASSEDISSLSFGSYTVTVTDASGCIANKTISVNEDSSLALSVSTTDVDCNSNSTGAINLTVAGGTAPYSYSWSNGSSSEDLSSLTAGTYTVSVTDFIGCNSVLVVTITEPDALVLSTTQVNVLCNGNSTGSIDLTVTGGTGPFSYSWSNGSSSQDIASLTAGTYSVTVTDANGCSDNTMVTITQPDLLALSTTQVNVDCNGNSTGSIDLTVTGGTGPFTYSWTNGSSSEDISSLAAGSYTVTVTDANGCSDNTMVTISQPDVLALSTTQVNVDCNGNSTGSIDLTVTGGTGPFTYSWTNGSSTEDIASLAAGSYTVTVTDANGCNDNAMVTITQPDALALSTTQVNVLCNGNSTGSIDLTVTGGTGPFTYSWSNGSSSEDIATLAAGSYTVTVTDANGCVEGTTVNITQPDALALSTTQVNVLCNGNSTGSIDLTVTGGTGPFTYSWSNGSSSQDVGSLTAGSYTVTVTDANGCSDNTMVTITQPNALALSTTQVNVDCNGNSTGSIDLTVTGGTGPYTYSWTNGSSSEDIASLSAGSYTVTVTDANGCVEGTTVNITQPDALALSTTQVNVLCNGNSTGSIDLTVTGGTGPFTYSWSNGSSSEDLLTLSAGPYTVTVTDANGCTDNTMVTITEPSVLSLSTTQVDLTCNGDSNGSIDLTVAGGTAPYSYSWTNGSSSEDISSLTAGSYTVTVTDANGCTDNIMVTITEPTAINLSTTQVNLTCKGDTNGSIDLTVSGGNAPYSYSWTNGSSSEDISSLTAGSYTVTVTDASGCTEGTTVILTEPATTMNASTVISNVSCNAGSDGAINLTVTGGTAPYTYAWSNGAITEDVTGLTAGTYSVTITDAVGCITIPNLNVTEPVVLALSTSKTDIDCNGNSNGTIDLTVTGGTAPYTYSWTNGSSSEDLSALAAGSYTVTVTDANGCTDNTMVTINEPIALGLSSTKTDVSCNAGNDGSIDLTVTGGTAPYTYVWSNGESTQDLSSLSAGNYSVTVTDANGCSAMISQIVNEPGSDINASYTVTDVNCHGGSDGSINLTVTGGTAPYSFTWDFGATTEDVPSLPAGSYSVTITDANGCITIPGIVISEPSAPISVSTAVINTTCQGANDGQINLTVSGGTAPYTFLWNTGAITEDITGLVAGSYSATVTDANGCSESINTVVTEPGIIIISSSSTQVSCFEGNDGAIDLAVSGGTAPYSYSWAHGASSEDINTLVAGNYSVVITDANGCSATESITITEPTALSLSETVTPAGCGGGIAGSIDLTVSGGTAPYSYSWSNGALTEDISGFGVGTYTIVVTDANGCAISRAINVNEDDALVLTNTFNDASCIGNNDGSIDLTVSGGVAPYSYLWSNGAITQDLNTLAAGIYSVTVTDASGCQSVEQITISEPANISIAVSQTDLTCNGSNDGTLALSLSGGTAPYTFSITNSLATGFQFEVVDANSCPQETYAVLSPNPSFINALSWSVSGTTINITGLEAQNYELVRADMANLLIQNILISEPVSINLTESINDVSCFGEVDGSITLSTTGGTGPYIFSWSNGSVQKDQFNLAAGSYTVTVTDNLGCSETATYSVTQPAVLSISSSINPVSCSGGVDGSITITASGGTAPYSYSWSNGLTTKDLSNLTAGDYELTITDSNNCTITEIYTITQPSALSPSITGTDISCNGSADGSIALTVSGGTGSYTYSWSNGASTQNLSGLASGNYTVTITDINGCIVEATALINEPPILSVGNVITQISCNGANDGAIDLQVSGGVQPYSFSWSNGANTEDLSDLTPGTYTATVTDANGCSMVESFEITEPQVLSFTYNTTNVTCFNGNQGSISLDVTGGTAPYSFSWHDGSNSQNRGQLTAGNYIVTVTDANSCSISQTIEISQPPVINLSFTKTDISCNGQQDGMIDLTVTGGTAPYSYSWSNGANIEDIDNLGVGTYTILVTDDQNCSSALSINIEEPETLTAVVSTELIIDCENRISYSNATAVVSGGTAPFTYEWNGGNTTPNATYQVLNPGNSTLIVTDANGCETTTTFEVTLPVLAESQLEYDALIDPTGAVTLNTAVIFNATNTGNAVSWAWNFGDGNTADGREARHTYTETGVYEVTLTVLDDNGCTQVIIEDIVVDIGYRIIMPTGFSPNNDGRNDRFFPEFYGLKYIRLLVFNNWGELVFNMDDIEGGGWDGLINGKIAPAGGYAYKLEAESLSGERIETTGSFMLVR